MRWRDKFRADLSRVLRHLAPPVSDQPVAVSALELMTIVLEDRRFFRHFGVDWRSILREVARALTFRAHGGFSTIDMQLVRTATGFRQHTIRRKLYEIALAIALQSYCDKRTILRSYLACAYFGSGLIGAKAAARKVFGTDPDKLDLPQAAVIGAMLACPRPLNGSPKWEARVRRRAGYGLSVYAANKQQLLRRYNIAFQS
jgi:membrane peptidoglycan carboxypeptidase